MVVAYWKNCEKIIKHNYSVVYEKKKQAIREKRLDHFVNKHLRLSSKVAQDLNTKAFAAASHNANSREEVIEEECIIPLRILLRKKQPGNVMTLEGVIGGKSKRFIRKLIKAEP
jgi:macrodomain Ter protein organizer (MatP/YcbG family)